MKRFTVSLALLFSMAATGCDDSTVSPTDGGLSDGTGSDGPSQPSPHGVIGRYSALALLGGQTLMASAYETRYGDLVVVSVETSDLTSQKKEIVDGVPSAPPSNPSSDWRGGVEEPGDDVGQDTDIVINPNDVPMIAYRDLSNRSLKLASRQDGKWSTHVVQQPGSEKEVVGRYSSMMLVDNKPAIAFVALNIAGSDGVYLSEVRWAQSTKEVPTTGGDWSITTVDSRPMSCQGLCPSDHLCIELPDNASECKKETTGCTECTEDEACIEGACEKVLVELPYEDVPMASGLWICSVVVNGAPLLFYYDRIQGNLRGASLAGGAWNSSVVTGDASDNVGAFCSAAVDTSQTVHVAYQDVGRSALSYIQIKDIGSLKPAVVEVIDDGRRIDGLHTVGADCAMAIDPSGRVRVIYQDTQDADLLSAVREGPNSWSPYVATDPSLGRMLLGGTPGYGFYSDLVVDNAKIFGCTFFYDQSSSDKGGLEFFELE